MKLGRHNAFWQRLLEATGLLSILFLNGWSAFGTEYIEPTHNFRSLAMGGTGISSANDTDVLHFNPATLANIGTPIIDLASIEYDENNNGKVFRNLIDLSYRSSDNTLLIHEPPRSKYVETLEDLENDNVYFRARFQTSAVVNFGRKGWALGLVSTHNVQFRSSTGSAPDLTTDLKVRYNRVLIGGISIPVPLTMGALVLGFSMKNYTTLSTVSSFTAQEALVNPDNLFSLSDSSSDFIRTYDFGGMLRIPGAMRLRLAGVARNFGGNRQVVAFDEKEEFAVGASMVPVIAPENKGGVRITLAADYRDIAEENTTSTDNDVLKRLHFGFELSVFPQSITYGYLSLRAGLNQGHPTYGLEVNLGTGRTIILGYASYTEELGNNSTSDPDERKVYYASFGLF